jgi:hypothetical protein
VWIHEQQHTTQRTMSEHHPRVRAIGIKDKDREGHSQASWYDGNMKKHKPDCSASARLGQGSYTCKVTSV